LLINPVVILAETAPIIDVDRFAAGEVQQGVFQMLHQNISDARIGPSEPKGYDYCADPNAGNDEWQQRTLEAAGYPRNPWVGLGLYTVLLAGSLWFTVNRLRVPYRTLRGGTRVA
jgi:hypothetical protein